MSSVLAYQNKTYSTDDKRENLNSKRGVLEESFKLAPGSLVIDANTSNNATTAEDAIVIDEYGGNENHVIVHLKTMLSELQSEKDLITSELRSARKHIAERDTEVAKLRATEAAHVSENVRLRAMLHEWSSRCAKLEHKLAEMQRVQQQ